MQHAYIYFYTAITGKMQAVKLHLIHCCSKKCECENAGKFCLPTRFEVEFFLKLVREPTCVKSSLSN